MPVDRRLWKLSLAETYAPKWPCPTCSSGTLGLKRDTLHYEVTGGLRRSSYDEHSDIMEINFTFSTLLECSNCNEKLSCCGVGGYEPMDVIDEDGSISTNYEIYFVPKYFSTPMKIFLPPAECPNAVKEKLRRSFAVFFCDLSAAANLVRQCVEEIISNSGTEPKDPQVKYVSLEKRICRYRNRNPENADRAEALKWIGNFGSHPRAINKDDLFDAYDILEVLLEDLYVGHQRSVRDMVERINESKAPRARTY